MTQTQGPVTHGADKEHFDSQENDLLVASEHADLVLATLQDLGIAGVQPEDSPLLGLTRLTFKSRPWNEQVQEKARRYLERFPGVQPAPAPAPDSGPDDIGVLLSAIKEVIMDRLGGWTPTLGRNRLVGHVTGTDGGPIVSGGHPILVPVGGNPAAGGFAKLADFVEDGPVVRLPGDGVRVGFVDTTLHIHSWLEGARVSPQPVPMREDPKYVRASHSAAMVGIVLQQVPGAQIDVVGVLGDQGWTTSWNAANAIASFAQSGIDILNLSFSCYTHNGEPPLALATAIDRLDPRIVVVAAAGNFTGNSDLQPAIDLAVAPAWPAALDDVVAVGAGKLNAETGDWSSASFSPKTPWVDIVAPGIDIVSLMIGVPGGVTNDVVGATTLLPDGPRFAAWSGTSPATAKVTAAIAKWMIDHDVSARVAWQELARSLGGLPPSPSLGQLPPGQYYPKLLTT